MPHQPKMFRMPLICLGTHSAPQMDVHVTPERARHWIESHKQITRAGNKVPIPWGHQLRAVPYGDADARRYALSRWNAGSVVDLEYNPATNWVEAVGTVPPGYEVETDSTGRPTGRLVNPTDHTTVSEMSAGVGNWRDGKGKVWRDIIVHAALCTLPVVAGQPGVTAALATDWDAREPGAIYAATLAADGVEYLYTLGTATMADDPKKKKPADGPIADAGLDGLAPDPGPDLDLDDGLPALPDPAAGPAPAPAATPLPAVTPDAQCATDVMSFASAVGLPLPADTTPANLLERLKVALSTVAALGWKLQSPQQAQPQDAQIQTGTEGAQPDQMGPGAAYMSTEPGEFVTLSADAAAVVEAVAQEKREAVGRKWNQFETAGHVRPDVAKRERDRLPQCKPVVDPVSKRVSLPDAVERLELAAGQIARRADATAALTGKPAAPVATLSTTPAPTAAAVAEPNPADATPDGRAAKADPDLLKWMAGEAGLRLMNGAA